MYNIVTSCNNFITINIHNQVSSAIFEVDVLVGAIGFETVLIPDIIHHIDLSGMNIMETIWNFKVNIPVNTRISARVKSDSGNADIINIDIIATG